MYKIIRPLLFRGDVETMHERALGLGRVFSGARLQGAIRRLYAFDHSSLHVHIFGIDFPNPVGLAAGFDKNGYLLDILGAFGFGFIEIGTVTPRPQPGNPRPRLFRMEREQGLVNRLGFNNEGVEVIAQRLKKRTSSIIVGVNIGKNKDTPNEKAVEDYETCFRALRELVDYIVVNVSSPNTPNLRKLQEKDSLTTILTRLQELNKNKKPILLKVAPDLLDGQLDDIIEVVRKTEIAGIVATNTIKTEDGGLSGRPLQNRSTEVIRYLHQKSQGTIPIIGVGGIFSGKDAYEKIIAGSSLVQLYTGLIYEGPGLVKNIKKDLVTRIKADGFSNIEEAVGTKT